MGNNFYGDSIKIISAIGSFKGTVSSVKINNIEKAFEFIDDAPLEECMTNAENVAEIVFEDIAKKFIKMNFNTNVNIRCLTAMLQTSIINAKRRDMYA